MQRFWEIVIYPSLQHLKPKHIIEIGSDKGGNTIKILNYCIENNCHFSSIDPFPQFDYQALEKQGNGLFSMVQDLSLQAISKIDSCDVALIDGDHNWYTVYNELQQIYLKNKQEKRKFPVVFFHDTGWPYGRRDMYYNPSNIPAEFIRPNALGGMFLNSPYLYRDTGMNVMLHNALEEGGEKNGVLTAIEDFVKDCELDLVLYSFEGLHGFSVLFENTKENHQIFSPFEIQKRISALVEQARLSSYFLRNA